MNATHNAFLQQAKATTQTLQEHLGELIKLDALYNGSANYNASLTQAEIDSRPELSQAGYTKAEINDAIYALAVIKGALMDHIPALSRLADIP